MAVNSEFELASLTTGEMFLDVYASKSVSGAKRLSTLLISVA